MLLIDLVTDWSFRLNKRLSDFIRLILAGLTAFIATLIGLVVIGAFSPDGKLSGIVSWIVFVGWISYAFLRALHLFNQPKLRPFGNLSFDQYIKDLEEAGLLEDTEYRAVRCFQVAEYGAEGSHYFVQLVDGGVLFLSGQYLYDYEPDEYEPEKKRLFPCEVFTLRRYKKTAAIMNLQCNGLPMEPEIIVPPIIYHKIERRRFLANGQIIYDTQYQELKEEMTRLSQSSNLDND